MSAKGGCTTWARSTRTYAIGSRHDSSLIVTSPIIRPFDRQRFVDGDRKRFHPIGFANDWKALGSRRRDPIAITGGQDDRQFRTALLQCAGKLQPGHARHHHVAEDDIEYFAVIGEAQRLGAIACAHYGMTEFAEQCFGKIADILIVFDQKHASRRLPCRRRPLDLLGNVQWLVTRRQEDRQRGAFAHFAFDPRFSARLRSKTINLAQAKPGSLAHGLGCEKGLKYVLELIRGDARPVIRDGYRS